MWMVACTRTSTAWAGRQSTHPEQRQSDLYIHVMHWCQQTSFWTDQYKTDDYATRIIESIANNENKFKLINDVIYTADNQLYVPLKERNSIIKSHHEDLMAGHPGIEWTSTKIATKYFWPSLQDDVDKFVRACETCLRRRSPRGPQQGLMHSIETSAPFQLIGIDFIGKLSHTTKDNEHILVAIDYFCKWVWAKPAKDTSAKTIFDFIIEEIFCRYGAPNSILCDNA